MYYQESENLIQSNPELRPQIEILDKFIGRPYGSQLDYAFMVSRLNIKQKSLDFLLKKYVEFNILRIFTIYICPEHDENEIGDTDKEEPFECPDCDREYFVDDCRQNKLYIRQQDPVQPIREAKMMSDYRWDVFISHSSKDKEIVLEIIDEFKSAGITYWVDHENIEYGDFVTAKIEEGLKHSKHIIVCLSPNLGKSNWCRVEYGSILNAYISGKSTRRAIPLLIADCHDDDIPNLLYDVMRADYSNKRSFEELLQFLKG